MATTLDDLFSVMRNETLSPELKALWGVYRSYENPTKGRGAWPGDELLAAHMGKSPRAVQRYRAELLRRGFLVQHLRGPNPAHYRAVIPEPSEDPDPGKPRQEWRNKEGREDEASPKGSPKGSPSVSPPVSPYYGKGGEDGKSSEFHSGADRRNGVPERDAFIRAVEEGDAALLDKLVGDHLYGFGPKSAEQVVNLAHNLVGALEQHGHDDEALAVEGFEAEVAADALRDLIRKSKNGRWHKETYASFVLASCRVRMPTP
jgi:hypothetical protein